MADEVPEPVADEADLELDARALRAWVEPADPDERDGDLVLVITDGDNTIRITSGMGGNRQLAVYGLQRLSGVVRQFGMTLKHGEPQPIRGPLTGP